MAFPLLKETLRSVILSLLRILGMVLVIDRNSDISAHVRSIICYLICLRHLFRSREVTYLTIFFLIKDLSSLVRVQPVLRSHQI